MNIIDSLVLTLGLDSSALKQGAKEATATAAKLSTDVVAAAEKGEKAQTTALGQIAKAWNAMAAMQRKAAESAVQNSKAMSTATETVVQSGEKALRTFGALFLLFAGARSMKDFAADITAADAALGRTAKSIGQTPEALSGIGRAVERMGGTFNGAVGGLKGLSDAFESMRTTGNSAIMEPLARLQGLSGKAITFGKDVHENFLSIADALKAEMAKDPAMADYLGRQILGDEGLTNLAKKGRAGVLAEEGKSPKITRQQTEDAAKLQEQLAAVRQGFQDIGNAILMDFGPSMIKAAEWVKDLLDKNRGLIESKVSEWVKDVGQWFNEHKADVENFGKAVGDLATAAGSIATAFASQSPMMQALEAFAVLMGGRVLGAVKLVAAAAGALASIPVPAWALAAMGLSAAAQWEGAKDTAKILGSADPTKNDVVVDPESGMATKVGAGEGNQGTGPGPSFNRKTGFIPWIKSLFGGGSSDTKTEDHIEDTAKSTKGILDILKSGAAGAAGLFSGSGGLGGSSTTHVGATLFDRAGHGRHHLSAGGGDTTHVSSGGASANLKNNPNATKENADSIRTAAKELGTTPEDLATVIGYETGGSFSPKKWGGLGGKYMGLIQFGKPEREMYGANENQSFTEQMPAVVRYLKDRGFKPGMGLMDLYSTVLTGSPGHYDRRDINGSVREHVARMQNTHGPLARAFLARGTSEVAATPTAPATPAAPATTSTMTEAEVKEANAWLASLGKDHPLTQAEHDKMGPLSKRVQDYYLSKTPGPMMRPANPGPPPKPGPEVSPEGRRQKDIDAAPAPKHQPTVGDATRHILRYMAQANNLAHHQGGAVPVEMTDGTVKKLEERTFGAYLRGAHKHLDIMPQASAIRHAASLDRMTRMAAGGAYHHTVNHADNRSDTRINSITVQTAATDARGIAADIEPHLHRGQAAGRADYGLA